MTSSPSTTTTPTPPVIPTIDIGPFLDGSDKNGVAQQINEACTTIGFFMVRNKTKTETETPRGCRLYIYRERERERCMTVPLLLLYTTIEYILQ